MECPKTDVVVQPMGSAEISIEKRLLKIVPAWKISPDDFLRMALLGVTNPVVPNGEEDPPFHRPSTSRPVGFDDGG